MQRLSIFFVLLCGALTPTFGTAKGVPQPVAPAPHVELTQSYTPALFRSTPNAERQFVFDPTPVRVRIPSIGLDKKIIPVGVTPAGDMAVPSGKTQNVGWYKDGTLPGNIGSAVLDAHVFAAFAELSRVPLGSDIFIDRKDGSTLHFVVTEAVTFPLEKLSPALLFNQRDAARLNLITCAGSLTKDGKSYTHRLVVFARLVYSSSSSAS